jgi:hypothetical protein
VPYQLLADIVLATHFAIVLFVIGGLAAIVLGNVYGWPFVNAWWFRVAHLAAIGVVVAQAWLGLVCPLTTLESALRVKAGGTGYETASSSTGSRGSCTTTRRRGCSRPHIRCSAWPLPRRGGGIRRDDRALVRRHDCIQRADAGRAPSFSATMRR